MKAAPSGSGPSPASSGACGETAAHDQPDESEAARIVVDQARAVVERELDVVVARGEFGVVEIFAAMSQAAAHSQMHDHRGAVAKFDD